MLFVMGPVPKLVHSQVAGILSYMCKNQTLKN